jgi:hypothetical protein
LGGVAQSRKFTEIRSRLGVSTDLPRRQPFIPPFMDNHGNFIISLSQLVRWLGEQAVRRLVQSSMMQPVTLRRCRDIAPYVLCSRAMSRMLCVADCVPSCVLHAACCMFAVHRFLISSQCELNGFTFDSMGRLFVPTVSRCLAYCE